MSAWTEQEISAASEFWKAGLSASQIGAKLGRTRNMVVAKASRHRDLFPGKQAGFHTKAPKAEKQPAAFTAHRQSAKISAGVHKDRTDPNFKPQQPVTIFDLGLTTCRWPLWGMDEKPGASSLYCGDLATDSSVYCPHHRRLGIGAGTASERAAV
jgi:hypothetical protein